MHIESLLLALVGIFGISALFLVLFHYLRLPSITAFLVTGVLVGPYGFGLVYQTEQISMIADLGVVLLLFTIGLEFSWEDLKRFRKPMLGVGGGQVLITVLLAALGLKLLGLSVPMAIAIGCIVALSSTAVVLNVLQKRREISSPHGQLATAVLLFQDLCVIPILLLLPVLGQWESGQGLAFVSVLQPLLMNLLKGVIFIMAIIFMARTLVPHLFHQVLRTKSREVFLVTVVVLCLGSAWLTSYLGLSLALGAFLAGVLIAKSDIGRQALSDVIPFRDIFMGLFFISIGLLVDIPFVMKNLQLILSLGLSVLLLKAGLVLLVALGLGYSWRVAAMAGLALAQLGEFSFVVAKLAMNNNLLTAESFNMLIAVTFLLMFVTPLLIQYAPHFVPYQQPFFGPDNALPGNIALDSNSGELNDHTLVIGFGVTGQTLANVLKRTGINYAVLDLNHQRVTQYRTQGEPIFYGDSTRIDMLEQMGLAQARVVVLTVSMPTMAKRIIKVIKSLRPDVHMLVRTDYMSEMEMLYAEGASQVVVSELESSIKLYAQVLEQYPVSDATIGQEIRSIRLQESELGHSAAESDNAEKDSEAKEPASTASNTSTQNILSPQS